MNRNASFARKVRYIAAIALLLLPLAALSQPATIGKDASAGGKLSQLRSEYGLAQAQLGEIDPASESMKLATLGLRGVAANLLWGYANHFKKVEDWDNLELTVNQIIRLQPNFLGVWEFQAHNLSYNVSVEFDDYRFRYEWVKKGIDFLITGTQYNRNEPGLLYQVGWFVGQKIGRSDESKQFRRLFRDDKDFHELFRKNGVEVDREQAKGPDGKPDNWLVARLWYNKAIDSVVYTGKPIRGKSPLLFYSGSPMSRINSASAMAKDGRFEDRTELAWRAAAGAWHSSDYEDRSQLDVGEECYGNREIPTSSGLNIRLNDLEAARDRLAAADAEIDKLAPGVRAALKAERESKLSDEEKAALKKPEATRTFDEFALAREATTKINVTNAEVIAGAPKEKRNAIRELTERMESDVELADWIGRYRGIVNFEYWRSRCRAEKMPRTLTARKLVYDADLLTETGEQFSVAKEKYEEAWGLWSEIFREFPDLMENAEAQDLIDSIKKYRSLLGQIEQPFPKDFVLKSLLERHAEGQTLLEQVKLLEEAANEKPAETKPAEKPADKPEESKPAEPKPAEETPAAGKPTDDKPTSDKPADEKPADEKPAEAKPADDKSADEKPADVKPAE